MPPAALPVALRGVTLMVRCDADERLPDVLGRVITVARSQDVIAAHETVRRLLLLPDPQARPSCAGCVRACCAGARPSCVSFALSSGRSRFRSHASACAGGGYAFGPLIHCR